MTTQTRIQATELLALLLANAAAAYLDPTNRPIDNKTTKATLDGAAAAAHTLGFGRTSAEVSLTAIDYVKANPRPAAGSAYPTELRVWSQEVRVVLTAELNKLA